MASGLAASASISAGAGSFYVEVDGVGFGDPVSTGYSDYDSLGRYQLALTTCTVPAGTSGFDNVVTPVLAGGSDTTYFVSNLLGSLYNQSPGCTVFTSTNSAGDCDTSIAQPVGATFANWDHDIIGNAFPIGSVKGRNQLVAALVGSTTIDFARSSSGLGSTFGVSLFDYASEGIAIMAVNPAARGRVAGPNGFTVTKAQLQAIYSTNATICAGVRWADLGDIARTLPTSCCRSV